MGKFIKWTLILGFLVGAVWFAYQWYTTRATAENALGLVPEDAIYVITTPDPIKGWKDISGSKMWTHLRTNAYFAKLTASTDHLDSMVRQNDILLSLVGAHRLLVSAHMTGEKTYDFLFLADLGEVAGVKLKFIHKYISDISISGYALKKEKYNGEELYTITNTVNHSVTYLSIPGKNLIASFSKSLLKKALDVRKEKASPAGSASSLAEIQLDDNGLIQLYVNASRLPAFMACYATATNEYVDPLSKLIRNASLDFHFADESLSAEGFMYINEEEESYLRTLAVSGKAATGFESIAPKRTGFALALGFTSFATFFENLQTNLQRDVTAYKSYQENLKQVEDYLSISLEKNFVSWVGEEIALIQLQSGGNGVEAEVALAIKSSNIEQAKKQLAYVEKMVRKRTPVKFKSVEHRSYPIRYLHMKGLFKLLLGKFFARYDKPYYTIIDNYVIFSNHPGTLESMIDDYLDHNTLRRQDDFMTFRNRFDSENAVFFYANTPILFNALKSLADQKTRASVVTNKEYIVCFEKIGFQLIPEDGHFRAKFAEAFVDPADVPLAKPAVETVTRDTVMDELRLDSAEFQAAITPKVDPMALPPIFVKDVNAKSFTGYFDDGSVQLIVEVRNGFKNGDYVEYYPGGKIKMKGNFKDEQRDGTWRLYDENGKQILRRTYRRDEVIHEK
ncbi:MAG TPA: DUF3352 domain-containing protein [Cyclobacteriaceae bacterium]|nr:DUF3352 domain-containing protein [Cyclobacteriaceae bacterium]